MPTSRIAVVGCGVAGMTAAALLSELGHEVSAFERAPVLEPVGAGVLIQPSGLLVLERLGLAPTIAAHGARIERIVMRTSTGKRVVDLHYDELGSPVAAYGIHRGRLFEALAQLAGGDRVDVWLGTEIVDRRGGLLVDSRGGRHGPFDVVVGADGSASRLRRAAGFERRTHDYRFGALWAIGRSTAVAGCLHQVVRGSRELVGLLPLGDGLMNVFWSQRHDRFDIVRAAGFEHWRTRVCSLCPEAEEALAPLDGFDRMALTGYRHAAVRRCHDDRLVLVGDAWHAMSPHLGQGVNLALIDAFVLARSFREAATVPAAFGRFAAARSGHIRYYAAATMALSPFFQAEGRVFGATRDLVLPVLERVGPLRRHMTLTMAGLAAGFVPRRFRL